jgi:signal transduction histidine kinase
VQPDLDPTQEAERLIGRTHGTILSRPEVDVSGTVGSAGAQRLPASALAAMPDVAPPTITGTPMRDMRRRSNGAALGPEDALQRRQRHCAHETAMACDHEFFAEAMHELRNVTASLCGFVDLLSAGSGKRSKPSKGRMETIKEIERTAVCLADLTSHIEDVICLRAERFAIHRQGADLVALVRRVVKRLHVTTQRHAIAVSTTAASIMAQVDVRRIEQVLTNLIGNAIKYSPDGGEITVKICVDWKRGRHIIAIRDHGIGIPKDQRGRVFERFGRADNARELGADGAGLGLYLSREIVERHGGHMWFRSRAGRGTTFCVSLPAVVAAPEWREPG